MKELERTEAALSLVMSAIDHCRNSNTALSASEAETLAEQVRNICLPPPEMEEVEVVRWEVYTRDGLPLGCCEEEPTNLLNGQQAVKLTGTLKRPKPQPVERTVSGVVEWDRIGGSVYPVGENADFGWDNLVGKTGILTFTWTEDPK